MKKYISAVLVFILSILFIVPTSAETDLRNENSSDIITNILGKDNIVASLDFDEIDAKTYNFIKNIDSEINPEAIGKISYVKSDDENIYDINIVSFIDENEIVSLTIRQLSENEDGELVHTTNEELFSSFKENLRGSPLYGSVSDTGITLSTYIYYSTFPNSTALVRPYQGKFRYSYNNYNHDFYVKNFALTYYAVGEKWVFDGSTITTDHSSIIWYVSQSEALPSEYGQYYSSYSYLINNVYIDMSPLAEYGSTCNYSFQAVKNANPNNITYAAGSVYCGKPM